jgi:hypothetical protein
MHSPSLHLYHPTVNHPTNMNFSVSYYGQIWYSVQSSEPCVITSHR